MRVRVTYHQHIILTARTLSTLSLSLSLSLSLTSITLDISFDSITCPHRAKICTFFSSQLILRGNLPENFIMSLFLLYQQLQQVLFVLLWVFVRWEVNGLTAVVLWGVASRICLKQHAVFLCRHKLAFSLCTFLKFMCCSHTTILKQLQTGNILTLFYRTNYSFIWSIIYSRPCLSNVYVDIEFSK